jgi:DNA-directed RNA polymerase specialized sigma24 family protein
MSIELLASAKNGSQSSISCLLVSISSECKTIISHFLGTKYSARIDADDVLQEVLIQVATGVMTTEFNDWNGFKAWLFCVCRNNVYKQVEYVKSLRRSADRTSAFGEGFDVGCDDKTAVEIVISRENLSGVMAVAASLPDDEFQVIEYLAQGMSPREAGEMVGKDAAFAYYARRQLKELLSGGEKPARRAVKTTDSANRARLKAWKKHYDAMMAIECFVTREKAIARFEKSLARLSDAERTEMLAFIQGVAVAA